MLFPPTDSFHMTVLIPSRDIDCAFPAREEDSEDEPLLDAKGSPIPKELIPPRSQVTLAGLLNVLDSVASKEERLTFATVFGVHSFLFVSCSISFQTNHIEQLDPGTLKIFQSLGRY
jgi:chaperone BCS1